MRGADRHEANWGGNGMIQPVNELNRLDVIDGLSYIGQIY